MMPIGDGPRAEAPEIVEPLAYRTGSYLVYDYDPAKNQPNFRKGTDAKILRNQFRASGSHQLDVPLLTKTLQDEVVAKQSPARLHLVDLREENHAFFNWRAVSWFADRDWANVWQLPAWIEEDEGRLIERAASVPTTYVFSYREETDGRITPTGYDGITVASAASERTVAEQPGWLSCPVSYHRLPVADHCPPFTVQVAFLDLLKQIDLGKDWVHFHCHGGDGRTTTFLALFDMVSWATLHGRLNFPSFDFFSQRQCDIFPHVSLRPDWNCNNTPKSRDWKYWLAVVRWWDLVLLRNYIADGGLASGEPFSLPPDWDEIKVRQP